MKSIYIDTSKIEGFPFLFQVTFDESNSGGQYVGVRCIYQEEGCPRYYYGDGDIWLSSADVLKDESTFCEYFFENDDKMYSCGTFSADELREELKEDKYLASLYNEFFRRHFYDSLKTRPIDTTTTEEKMIEKLAFLERLSDYIARRNSEPDSLRLHEAAAAALLMYSEMSGLPIPADEG